MSENTRMRQVTKEEYEILRRFHKAEIRYYVDIGTSKRTSRGKKKKGKRGKKKYTPGVVNGTGKGYNRGVVLSQSSYEFKPGTKSEQLMNELKKLFNNDPTVIIGRTDLKTKLAEKTGFPVNSTGPFISDCINRYKVLSLK